jgi:hypothetical protein
MFWVRHEKYVRPKLLFDYKLMLSEEKTEICTTFRLDNDCCAQAEVFCVVTPCSVVVGYKCFKGPCCLHLQGEVLTVASP